jgi:predicted nuclease of restriction endonuclease-like (RecB) superfamily
LSCTHFKDFIYLDDFTRRNFYAEACRIDRWNTRTLRHKIGHLLYERTAGNKKPDELIQRDLALLRDEAPDE